MLENRKEQFKRKVKKKCIMLAIKLSIPLFAIMVLLAALYNSPFAIFLPSRDEKGNGNKDIIAFLKQNYSEAVSNVYNYKTTDNCNDLNSSNGHDDYDGGVNSIEENNAGNNLQSIYAEICMLYSAQMGDGEDPCELTVAHKELLSRIFGGYYVIDYTSRKITVNDHDTVGSYLVNTYEDTEKKYCYDVVYNPPKKNDNKEDDNKPPMQGSDDYYYDDYDEQYKGLSLYSTPGSDDDDMYDGMYDGIYDNDYSEKNNDDITDGGEGDNDDEESDDDDEESDDDEEWIDPSLLYEYNGKVYRKTEEEDEHLPYVILKNEEGNSSDFPFACTGSVIEICGQRFEVIENTENIPLTSAVTIISQPGRGDDKEQSIDDYQDIVYCGTSEKEFYRKFVKIDSSNPEEYMDEYNYTEDQRKLYYELKEAFNNSDFAAVFKGAVITSGKGNMVGNSVMEIIWNYFTSAGYSEIFVAGMMGNMYQESSFNPASTNYHEDGSIASVGLIQWDVSGGRYQKFMEFAALNGMEWTEVQVQIMFIEHEFTGDFKDTFNYINEATTVEEAAFRFHEKYEISADTREMIQKRMDYAKEIYDSFQGTSVNNKTDGLDGNAYSYKQLQRIFTWIPDDMPYFIDHEPRVNSEYTATTRTDVDSSVTNTSRHTGIDLAASTGDALTAIASGTVIHAGWQNGQHYGLGSGYGYYLMVQCDDGTSYTYGHMQEDSIPQSLGDRVETGEYVGNAGATGEATGPHVHLTLTDTEGNRVNDNALGRYWDSSFNGY